MQRTVLASLQRGTRIHFRSGPPLSFASFATARFYPRRPLRFLRTVSTTPPAAPWRSPLTKLPWGYKSASVAWTAASFVFLYDLWAPNTSRIVLAESEPPSVAFSRATPASTVEDLADLDNRIATKTKSTKDLLIALCVYKLCMFPTLVDITPHILHAAETLHLQTPMYWLIKRTIFRQFCGGETAKECVTSIEHLSRHGVGAILDLSVEADIRLDNKKPPGTHGYHQQQERHADMIVEKIMECVSVAAQGREQCGEGIGAFAAVKVTAIAPPELLLRLNQTLLQLTHAFDMLKGPQGRIDTDGLRHITTTILPPPQTKEQEHQRELLIAQAGELDEVAFDAFFNLDGPNRAVLWATNEDDMSKASLTVQDLQAYDRVIERLHKVCRLAHERQVGIMIDAEQSYFQDAIDHVAMNMQAVYNRREDVQHPPVVYNTYQMYTKTAQRKLERDVERASRENFGFAAKLVRGAYMVSERKRAEVLNLPSPIHDSIDATHASFNHSVVFLLHKLQMYLDQTDQKLNAATAPIVFMVATHNRESIAKTVQEMERHHVLPRSGVVYFGQLFGMQDQISFILGRNGYSIYKYLPYGKIDKVMPYLIRRAQENSAVMDSITKECQLMWLEIKERLRGKVATLTHSMVAQPATKAAINDTNADNVD